MNIAINKRMKELRSLKKNTQEQLAAHLGITTQAVSKWERGEEIITFSQRLLKDATQSGEYFGAINNLCRAYMSQGNIEEAKCYAAMGR